MSAIVYNDFSYLEPYKSFISRTDFWLEVLAQLNKDFGNSEMIKLDPGTDFQGEKVAEIFVEKLQKALPSVTPQLSEILYRMDVSEKQVESLKDLPDDIYFRCLAEVVLKREILKVVLRKAYSGKKNT